MDALLQVLASRVPLQPSAISSSGVRVPFAAGEKIANERIFVGGGVSSRSGETGRQRWSALHSGISSCPASHKPARD